MTTNNKTFRVRNCCFTSYKTELNIATQEEDQEGQLFPLVKYYIYQREICPETKKEHWQGYIEFLKPQYLNRIKEIIGDETAHIEKRKGTQKQAIEYCKKSRTSIINTIHEFGDPGAQGQRNDLKALYDDIKNGNTLNEIVDKYPTQFIRYSKGIEKTKNIIDEKKDIENLNEFKELKLNKFQQEILTALELQNNRQVLWICDKDGGKGKTWLSKYLIVTRNGFRCCNGKNADIAYAYHCEPYFIMDLSRSMEEHVNYDIIEQVKNGMIFSPKYESKTKIFKPPKILILANFMPDQTKLSQDRWQILVY